MRSWYHLNSEKYSALCQYGRSKKITDTVFPLTVEKSVEAYSDHILSVHCSKATSIPPSRRLAPAVFSLGIGIVCTPPRQRRFICVRLYNNSLYTDICQRMFYPLQLRNCFRYRHCDYLFCSAYRPPCIFSVTCRYSFSQQERNNWYRGILPSAQFCWF